MHPGYMIVCTKRPWLYWSNESGWIGVDFADEFSEQERNSLNLPVGGEWETKSAFCVQQNDALIDSALDDWFGVTNESGGYLAYTERIEDAVLIRDARRKKEAL